MRRIVRRGLIALTQREREVLLCVANGMVDKEIARALGICYGTVKGHVNGIFNKMDAKNRSHAAYLAGKAGL